MVLTKAVLVLTKTVLVLKNLQGLGLEGDGLNYITAKTFTAAEALKFKQCISTVKIICQRRFVQSFSAIEVTPDCSLAIAAALS